MVLEAGDEVIGIAHNDDAASGHSAVAGWRPSSSYFCDLARALGFGLGQLANRRVPPWRFRSDLQLCQDHLTLRCNEMSAAAELLGNLFVWFSSGEAPQQLLLLRRYLVVFR
jgi:hypothetical protein